MEQLFERLPGLTIVVGKGGVGKTTCAIGVAARLAARGEKTLLIATDPAESLAPALGITLAHGEARAVEEATGLFAMQLDPVAARTAFLNRWRDVLITIVDRGTYLDTDDIGGLIDASMPGADEIFGLLVLAQLVTPDTGSAWNRIVVDTAPTGHTLRLLALPDTFTAMISLLDSMQAKYRFMVRALTRRYRRDAADDFLDEMRGTLGQLRETLSSPSRSAAILVVRPESVIVSETVRYAAALQERNVAIAAIVVDAMDRTDADEAATMSALTAVGPSDIFFALPRLDPPPVGLSECAAALGRLDSVELAASQNESMQRARKGLQRRNRRSVVSKVGGPPRPQNDDRLRAQRTVREMLRTLTIVGGKGGVGKTTVSCALAIFSVFDDPNRTGDVLLVSTDPAPSIGDALGIGIANWARAGPQSLDVATGLYVWQIDAASAFSELRDRYRDRIDNLFDALTGGSIDIAHDRAILRDLLALAPPGIDELYALASLGDAVEAGRYERIIVDPAPTGHLLRLIELPALAIDWSHRLMRLIMKYREVSGLVEAAQDLVNFSRRTRALDRLLRDSSNAGVVLVSLDEPLVVAETNRLSSRLSAGGVAIHGLVRNRSERNDPRVNGRTPVVLAPEIDPPPVGVAAIRDWCERWRRQD
ncbi:MAG TPA: ArsA family ATPase [Gemmatimonadaceae bacterium]|nr:ArsA family ATPase [Gemmatimonadaceae bacterium]